MRRVRERLSSLRDERGFTLIEIAVAMPIMLIVMGGMTLMLTTITHWSSQTQEETILQTESRAAVNRLETEIHGAFIGNDTPEITAATATSITFTTPDEVPTTYSGPVGSPTELAFHLLQVSYNVTNGVLQRRVATSTNTFPTAPLTTAWSFGAAGAWSTVLGQTGLGHISNTNVFTYYTASGLQTTPPTALTFPISSTAGIKAVGVNFSLTTGGSQPDTLNITDIVDMRQTDN